AVLARSLRRIELRHGAKVLYAHVCNPSAFFVLQHFPAPPTLFNRTSDRRVDSNGISLNIANDAVPLHIERTPAALRIGAIHADSIDPVLVSNATHDQQVARPEALRRSDLEFSSANRNVVVNDGLFRFF